MRAIFSRSRARRRKSKACSNSISVFDVDVMKGMSFAVVPVKTPQPEKMVDELKAVFAAEKEGPLKGRVRFIANTRLGAILVVTSQPSYLPRAQTWIRRLDAKAAGSERQLHVYQVQNRPVAELAGVLQSMFANEMKVVKPPTRSVSPRSKQAGFSGSSARSPGPGGATPDIDQGGATGLRGGVSPGNDLQSLQRALNNEPEALAPDPMESSSSSSSSNGAGGEPPLKIVADETKNSLLIMANERDYQRVLRVIQGLDVVASQVLIEAVIAEVTLNDKLQYGVQWQLVEEGHADRLVLERADRRRRSGISRVQLCRQRRQHRVDTQRIERDHARQCHFDAFADGSRQQDGAGCRSAIRCRSPRRPRPAR